MHYSKNILTRDLKRERFLFIFFKNDTAFLYYIRDFCNDMYVMDPNNMDGYTTRVDFHLCNKMKTCNPIYICYKNLDLPTDQPKRGILVYFFVQSNHVRLWPRQS